MRRSLLFIPANSPAMLQNADVFEADAIIFDFEDAIHLLEKDAARDLLFEYFKSFQLKNIEKIVRINQFDSPYFNDDLNYVLKMPIDTIMVPKASVEAIDAIDQILQKHEKRQSSCKITLIPIIEQAISLFEIEKIASHKRVSGLLLGGEDLATNLEVDRTLEGQEILFARQLLIYAAKAFGKDAIDTPFTDLNNEEGLIFDSHHAKRLGMNAKACIHPIQIDVINQTFSPTQKEITYATRVLEAEMEAQKLGKGAFSVDGKMIDKPIILRAKRLLEKVKS